MTARIDGHLRWYKWYAKTKFGVYGVRPYRDDMFRWTAELVPMGSSEPVQMGVHPSAYEAMHRCEKDFMKRVHDEYEEVYG